MLLALAAEGAEFLIIGAYALAFHGVPRTTGDIDLFVRPTADNAARVWRALSVFGAPLAANGVTVEDLATPDLVYQIGLPPRRIDVMTAISGVDFEEAWESRVTAELDGKPIPVIAKDTLVRNKRAAGRARDLADLERLGRG